MYAKIEDNALTIAPEGVTEGYKPVRFIDPVTPPSGYYVEYGLEETENEIVQIYELVPIPDDVTPDVALSILLGEEGSEE